MSKGPGIVLLVLGIVMLCVGPLSWAAIASAADPASDVDFTLEDVNDTEAAMEMYNEIQDKEVGEEYRVLVKDIDETTLYSFEMIFDEEGLEVGDDVIITYEIEEMMDMKVPVPASLEKYDPGGAGSGSTGPVVGALLMSVGIAMLVMGVILLARAPRASPYGGYPPYHQGPYSQGSHPRYGPPTPPQYIDPYSRPPSGGHQYGDPYSRPPSRGHQYGDPYSRPPSRGYQYGDPYSRPASTGPGYRDDPYGPSYGGGPSYDQDYRPGPPRPRYYEEY